MEMHECKGCPRIEGCDVKPEKDAILEAYTNSGDEQGYEVLVRLLKAAYEAKKSNTGIYRQLSLSMDCMQWDASIVSRFIDHANATIEAPLREDHQFDAMLSEIGTVMVMAKLEDFVVQINPILRTLTKDLPIKIIVEGVTAGLPPEWKPEHEDHGVTLH